MEPEILFKRKITEKLLQWKKESKGEKALLIEGARRIGKSTAVEEFAKAHYLSYLLIDFNKARSIVFDNCRDNLENLSTFFMVLALCSTSGFPQSAQNTSPEKMFGSSICFAARFLCCRTSCTISHCSCVMSGWCVFFTRHCSLSGRSIRVLFL